MMLETLFRLESAFARGNQSPARAQMELMHAQRSLTPVEFKRVAKKCIKTGRCDRYDFRFAAQNLRMLLQSRYLIPQAPQPASAYCVEWTMRYI